MACRFDVDGNYIGAPPPTPAPGALPSVEDLLCTPSYFVAKYARLAHEAQVLLAVADAGAALDVLFGYTTEQVADYKRCYALAQAAKGRIADTFCVPEYVMRATALDKVEANLRLLDTRVRAELATLDALREKLQALADMNHNVAQQLEIAGAHSLADAKGHLATIETILLERLEMLVSGKIPLVHFFGDACWPAFATGLASHPAQENNFQESSDVAETEFHAKAPDHLPPSSLSSISSMTPNAPREDDASSGSMTVMSGSESLE
ncbi:hypothetical protein SPRG_19074 [Saprolegnia parasitica CBS 223.65]|uniref:Uncharacterized protein n=1 Tax=Saprolegnia parasitica (strain CBS 223.65) TaxID=695850 RepID=A0A067D5G4_SAPPC|nr:hypothetical protein SPRG_19074 [Saprolegnia parasitica CBS 223.65]KDO34237.1 hypothetical protein SPRG_19074 [Saprolegnia parasitica CBS 223.65]|eukprot:XP_012195270.1 hypothetical protein SPRG_19074 [Saprolegnia parasitica CBS 223.65]